MTKPKLLDSSKDSTKWLVIGQGSIGRLVSHKLAHQGKAVTGLARGERETYDLMEDIDFIQADAKKLTAVQIVSFTHIVVIVTPDTYDANAYENTYFGIAQHLAELAQNLPNLQRIVFISSTGVYGQDKGKWVDEHTQPEKPKRAGSRYILQAEQVLQQAYGERAIIIRPSGIYGIDRRMRIDKAGEDEKSAMPQYAWTNRIIDSDLVNIIVKVLTLPKNDLKPMYLATDYLPVTSFNLTQWLSQQLNKSLPNIDISLPASGKRLHSNIPLDWLEYPDWQAGYKAVLGNL